MVMAPTEAVPKIYKVIIYTDHKSKELHVGKVSHTCSDTTQQLAYAWHEMHCATERFPTKIAQK